MSIFCPSCGKSNDQDQSYCRSCGLDIRIASKSVSEQTDSGSKPVSSDQGAIGSYRKVFGLVAFPAIFIFGSVLSYLLGNYLGFSITYRVVFIAIYFLALCGFAGFAMLFWRLLPAEAKEKISKPKQNDLAESNRAPAALNEGFPESVNSVTEDETRRLYVRNKTNKL